MGRPTIANDRPLIGGDLMGITVHVLYIIHSIYDCFEFCWFLKPITYCKETVLQFISFTVAYLSPSFPNVHFSFVLTEPLQMSIDSIS